MEIKYSQGRQKQLEDLVVSLQKNPSVCPPLLDDTITEIALTGLCCYPWLIIKDLLAAKLTQLLDWYNTNDVLPNAQAEKQRLCTVLKNFDDPPFTLQRLCELLSKNTTIYKSAKSFTFAIEKVLYVSLTVSVLKPDDYNQKVKELMEVKSQQIATAQSNQDHGSLANRRGTTVPPADSSPNTFDPMDIDKD